MTLAAPAWLPNLAAALVLGLCPALACAQRADASDPPAPPGADKTARTRALELGAKVLQQNAPVARMDIYLNGFHPLKNDPGRQMEAHHFCHQRNQDFAQCALFDGTGPEANLHGVEYIISARLFASLPEAEKKYWHPHNGEILSGQLVAPGIPQVAETALMKDKMNSYGKTWHFWNTGMTGRAADELPFGEPHLAWSFNREGEADPALVAQRNERLGIRSTTKRNGRAALGRLARPQAGVDDLKDAFGRPTQPIPGVVDQKAPGSGGAEPASR